jgi:UDP-N-acetylmuramoylalanine--D-glutamate ligase
MTERAPDGRERGIADVAALRLRGPHNLQNALAAALAALRMEIAPGAVAEGLALFPGVPHRLEEVAEIGGVLFVNDSKATNVDATRWAVRSFNRPLHLILGGRHKGSPYAPLLEEMAGKVKQVLALGEARERIAAELGGGVPVRTVGSLAEAVEAAFRDAVAGDVVLLSPACASYDMFRDFEDRGEAFRRSVRSLDRAGSGRGAARRERA